MGSNGKEDSTEEIHAELESGTSPSPPKLREYRIRVPSLNARLLGEQILNQQKQRKRLLDFVKARPSTEWFNNFRLSSPLAVFRRTVDEREEISLSVPSPVGIRRRFDIHFIRRINWSSLFNICKEWLKHPLNIALLLWLLCVAVSGTMLGLILLGLLNKAFPTTASRNHWIELNNQVLNALFTLMSLYQHPSLFHHLVLLCRWRSEDIIELRKIYCKNAAYRPHEWAHMMVVVALLHITCLAQYALCGLYWGYSSKTRPEFAENFFFALGIGAPVFAAVYTVYSPLGREYDSDSDEESQAGAFGADVKQANKLGLRLYSRRVLASKPEWNGGLFDCSEDVTVGYLSFFCTCCVFGWNMERLGFGNMYVHIVTFLLLCVAPFWIFNITALHIHDYVIGDMIGITGIVLCVCGLIYGGFWRIQMRKRFKLPGNTFCCGFASLTDYFQWMFCWSCSLAQEVRTGNFYDVEDDSLYTRLMDGDIESSQPVLHPLPCSPLSRSDRSSSSPFPSPLIRSDRCYAPLPSPLSRSDRCSTPLPILPNSIVIQGECGSSLVVEEVFSAPAPDDAMTPPVQPLIKLDDGVGDGGATAPLMKLEDCVIDGETIALPSSSSSIQTQDTVSDGNIIAPLIKLEDRVGDGGTIAAPSGPPLIQIEDNLSTLTKLAKFVKVMQYGLFIIVVYALASTIIH